MEREENYIRREKINNGRKMKEDNLVTLRRLKNGIVTWAQNE